MALPFEFVIEGTPVSYQTRNRAGLREWRRRVRLVAEQYWPPGAPPATGSVMLTIIYFYDHARRPLDVDNIPKPILDALKGIVFQDDDQVTDLVCRKRNVSGGLRVASSSDIMDRYLNIGVGFIYIAIEEAPNQEVI